MSDLLFTVGLPRSGKTTLANKLRAEEGYVVVNPDSFRLAIHGQRFLASAEPFVWAAVYASVDALMLSGHRVIVDATNISRERREPWQSRGGYPLVMGTTTEECIRRAMFVADGEIIPVIERMARECDLPMAIGL
jgi:hypothetical protein